MGLITGNDKEWLRLMLDDDTSCIKMGVPTDLSDKDKDLIVTKFIESVDVDGVLDGLDGLDWVNGIVDDDSFIQVEDEKQEDETASDWLVRAALSEMDLKLSDYSIPTKVGAEIQSYNLLLDTFYLMTFPNGNKSTVKLNRIMKNSFGDDYIFENHGGAESLADKSNSRFVGENEFPLPQQFLSATKFNLLN